METALQTELTDTETSRSAVHREDRVYSLVGFNEAFPAFSLNINRIA